jgi:hypothetical protein
MIYTCPYCKRLLGIKPEYDNTIWTPEHSAWLKRHGNWVDDNGNKFREGDHQKCQ